MATASEDKKSKYSPNEWENSDFQMAQERLVKAAKAMKLDESVYETLKNPKRALCVVVPARMDDGTVRVFSGYRVHHDLALGPGKGGFATTAESTSRSLRHGHVDDLEMRPDEFTVRGALTVAFALTRIA